MSGIHYLLGVMLGDGYMYHQKTNRSYLVCLKCKDYDFIEKFRDNIYDEVMFRYSINIEYNKSCKRGFHYICRASRKELFDRLTHLTHNYRKIIKDLSISEKINFLSGIFDSEGCVTLKKYSNRIILNNKNRKLIYLCKRTLNELGISSVIYKTRKICGDYYELNIQRRIDILNFISTIPLVIERKNIRLNLLKQSILRSKYPLVNNI